MWWPAALVPGRERCLFVLHGAAVSLRWPLVDLGVSIRHVSEEPTAIGRRFGAGRGGSLFCSDGSEAVVGR